MRQILQVASAVGWSAVYLNSPYSLEPVEMIPVAVFVLVEDSESKERLVVGMNSIDRPLDFCDTEEGFICYHHESDMGRIDWDEVAADEHRLRGTAPVSSAVPMVGLGVG